MDTVSAVERYGTMVYRLAYAQLRSRHDADDVFQEVFLRYHRASL
ncbi:RNA polymerase sigma factor [uncultured Oscillibacter sp.]|nr:sigma factor [uncultured Oscillibacter sp.]